MNCYTENSTNINRKNNKRIPFSNISFMVNSCLGFMFEILSLTENNWLRTPAILKVAKRRIVKTSLFLQ
jgi:hypothetical protein